MKEVKIIIGNKIYKVELAETESEHELGLQNREKLESDEGMLFVFEDEEERGFWMKNTIIPLDIIFISEDLIVTTIHKGVPQSEEIMSGICSYVLEVNQNSGIKVGDELEFDNKKMLVLNSNAEIQMKLDGGERIMSRPHTKTLIKFAKKADITNNDNDYRKLGKRMFKFLQVQESTPEEYVEK